MTISSTYSPDEYTGDASTVAFPYTFKIFAETDLRVILVDTSASPQTETVQTLTTHYSVSGVGGAGGGNVTMVTAPAATDELVIKYDMDETQPYDYTENDPFPAATHENALDRQCILTQQTQEQVDRALKFTEATAASGVVFPEPEAELFVRWNEAGDDLENAAVVSDGSVATATTTTAGIAEIATDAEMVTAIATDKIATPENLTARFSAPGPIGDSTASTSEFTKTMVGSTSLFPIDLPFHATLDDVTQNVKVPLATSVAIFSNTAALSNTDVSIYAGDQGDCRLLFGDAASHTIGAIRYRHGLNSMNFDTNGSTRLNITYVGAISHTAHYDNVTIDIASTKLAGVSDPTWTAYKGGYVLSFAKAADNIAYFTAQLPHSYEEGADFEFHIHIAHADAEASVNSRWNLTYSMAAIDSDFPAETTASATVASPNDADKHEVAEIAGTIDGTNAGISTCLICSIQREGTHVDDDYDDDIYLVSMGFRITKDSPGSINELSKS